MFVPDLPCVLQFIDMRAAFFLHHVFSFWSGNNPAIALTLRHDRIENFAFTQTHEIAHIDLHLKNIKKAFGSNIYK